MRPMRPHIRPILRTLLLALAIAAPATATAAADQGLIVTPTPLDFGKVDVGAAPSAAITLTNTNTTLAVTISAPLGKPATPDCDAFTPNPAPTLPDTLAPNTTRTWTFTFKPTAAQSYDCQWKLADDDNNDDVVHLQGAGVRGHLTVQPNKIDFGSHPTGTTTSQDLTLGNDGQGSITVTAIGDPAAPFAATHAVPPIKLAPNQTATITVKFAPTIAGAFSDALALTDDDPGTANLSVALSGTGTTPVPIMPTINVSPDPVAFGTVMVGASATKPVQVGNTGNGELDVTSMTITGANAGDLSFADAALGCTGGQTCNAHYAVAAAPSTPRTVQLECSPTAGGARVATLTVVSNATGGKSTANLQCTGGAPTIGVNPGSMAFGTIRVATTAHQKLTISNSGTSDLLVSAVSLDGANPGDYVATGDCTNGCTIPVGKSSSVDVAFTPTVRGRRLANLHVRSNDLGRPDVIVALDGTGGLPVLVITQPAGKDIDFGLIPIGTMSSTAPVTVQNQGELTLNLTAAFKPDPSVFAGGAPATVALAPTASQTWNLSCKPKEAATVDRAFLISGNDPVTPSDQVAVHCTGIDTKLIAIPSPLSFGQVRTDRKATQTITITNIGALGITINSASIAGGGPFTDVVGGTLPRTLGQNDKLTIDVTFAPTTDAHFKGTLTLTDNHGAAAAIIALSGDGRTPAYGVSPQMLDFGPRCVGQADAHDVVITNTGTATIRLTSVAISGGNGAFAIASGAVASPIDLAPKANRSVSIVGTPPAGSATGNLIITTDVDAHPTTMVGLAITGTESGVVANPAALAFGPNLIGAASPPMSVSINNCSAKPLTISSATVTGDDAAAFEVSGLQQVQIPIGGDQSWDVVFTAQHDGSHGATLALANDGATNPIAIPLSGEGSSTAPPPDAEPGTAAMDKNYYGCGCHSNGEAGAQLALALIVILLVRRRS